MNQATKVIKEYKQKYYNEINSLCASDTKKMSEIKQLVLSKARSTQWPVMFRRIDLTAISVILLRI